MLGAKAVVFPLCAGFCLLVAGYLLLRLRRSGRQPALVALLAAFLCKAVSFGLAAPRGSAAVDAFTGVPNLGALGIHLAGGVLSTAAMLVAVTHWTRPLRDARRRSLRWLAGAGAVGAVMVALWLVANIGVSTRSPNYLMRNAGRPVVAAYLLLYVSAFALQLIAMARIAWRCASATTHAWLRRGLRTIAVGATIYVFYSLNRISAVVAAIVGADPVEWEVVTLLANGAGILLLGVGVTMPDWGPRLTSVWRAVRDYRQCDQLYLLWHDLYRAHPSIALAPRSRAWERRHPRDLAFRRYRRVVEIRDGLLCLGDVIPQPVTPDDDPARIAGLVRAALDGSPQPPAATPGRSTAAVGFDDETTWLLAVAGHYRALRRGPAVARRRRVDAAATSGG